MGLPAGATVTKVGGVAISPVLRFRVWIGAIVVLLGGMPIWMAALRGPRIIHANTLLISGWIGFSLIILLIWWLLKTTPANAIRLSEKRSRWILMLGAAWLHANAIGWLSPAMSEEIIRYRVDGRVWSFGWSPYAINVGSQLRSMGWTVIRYDKIDQLVGGKPAYTHYLPTAQITFLALRQLDDRLGKHADFESLTLYKNWQERLAGFPWHQRLVLWRAAFGGLLLLSTWFLIRACVISGRSPWWAAILSWHPLAIVETSGMGHQEAIGIALLAMACWAWTRANSPAISRDKPGMTAPTETHDSQLVQPLHINSSLGAEGTEKAILAYDTSSRRSDRSPAGAGVFLALASGVNPIAIVVALFWAVARPSTKWIVPGLITLTLLSCMLVYQDGYRGLGEAIQMLWTHASETSLLPLPLAAGVGLVTFICLLARTDWITGFYWTVLANLLLYSGTPPWWLLWVLAIVPLLNASSGLTGLVYCATVVLHYRHVPFGDAPQSINWLAIQYLPVYLALVLEIGTAWKNRATGKAAA